MKNKTNAVILTANQPRHNYFVKTIGQNFDLKGVIIQPKKKYYSNTLLDKDIVKAHFDNLSAKESQYFGKFSQYIFQNKKFDTIETSDINDEFCIDWVRQKNPKVIFLFGTQILSKEWFDNFEHIINLHLGLSPFYRGSATLFWPFYNKDLNHIGATIHLAISKVDAGPIIKQVKPDIKLGDNYYEINYKTIKKSIDEISTTTYDFLNDKIELKSQDFVGEGLLYKKEDFTHDALKKALRYVENGVTSDHLENLRRPD
jgi:folate-dependent phosphoribosylglycinamide formyltransferase PurN